jgi:hypothetical protein
VNVQFWPIFDILKTDAAVMVTLGITGVGVGVGEGIVEEATGVGVGVGAKVCLTEPPQPASKSIRAKIGAFMPRECKAELLKRRENSGSMRKVMVPPNQAL